MSSIQGAYLWHTVAIVPVPEAFETADAAVRAGVAALDPWRADALALTFIDGPGADAELGFGSSVARLRELKRRYDPADIFAAARPV